MCEVPNDFKFSTGWVQRLKTRHNVKAYKCCGSATGIDADELKQLQSVVKTKTEQFRPDEIYIFYKIVLFWKLSPGSTLSIGQPTTVPKKYKDRLTIGQCCDAPGSDKIKPFVIGTSLHPRALKNFNYPLLVDYTANKKGWNTQAFFKVATAF